MFPHILRRRARRSRTSVAPFMPRPHRERTIPWRRPLTWVALLTLVASALYFSIADRQQKPAEPPAQVP
jgi:hypothetical protein